MHTLNVFLHENRKPPGIIDLSKRMGDGAYATITNTSAGYLCKVTVVTDGQRALVKELQDNSLGGYLTELERFMDRGLNLRAILLQAKNNYGLKHALSIMERAPLVVTQKIED